VIAGGLADRPTVVPFLRRTEVPDVTLARTPAQAADLRHRAAALLLRESRGAADGPAFDPGLTVARDWPDATRARAVPRYVDACACERWRLVLVPRAGGVGRVVPYRCRSRRHAGDCATSWRRELYCRIRDGQLGAADPREVCFATWTLPAAQHRICATPPEYQTPAQLERRRLRLEQATARLCGMVSAHFRELNQRRARAGLPRLRYLWVVEAHKSGVPHAHAIVWDGWLAAELSRSRAGPCPKPTCTQRGCGERYHAGPPPSSWADAAPAGVGRMDFSLARGVDVVASYCAKLAGEAAKGQGVLSLGRHTRTYGASRGFLAARRPSAPGWTGTLVGRSGRAVTRPRAGTSAAELHRRLTVTTGERVDWTTGEVTTDVVAVECARPASRRPTREPVHNGTDSLRSTNIARRQPCSPPRVPREHHTNTARLAAGSRARPLPFAAPRLAPMVV
jgi:hypothetical protein